jgi:hypothetical protein
MRCPRPVLGRNGDPSCQRLSGHSLSPSLLIVIRGLAGQRTADPRGFFRLVDWPELRRFDLGQLERMPISVAVRSQALVHGGRRSTRLLFTTKRSC